MSDQKRIPLKTMKKLAQVWKTDVFQTCAGVL